MLQIYLIICTILAILTAFPYYRRIQKNKPSKQSVSDKIRITLQNTIMCFIPILNLTIIWHCVMKYLATDEQFNNYWEKYFIQKDVE